MPEENADRGMNQMDPYRNNARVAGALLITAFIAGISGAFFTGLVNDPDYLVEVAESQNLVIVGVLMETIMAFACAGIAIWLYPVLKRHNAALALASVGFRIIEAVLFIVTALSLLLMVMLSQEYVQAGNPDAAYFSTSGALLRAVRDGASNVLAVFAFSLGALAYYYIFFKSRLIPRWLSGWGLIAISLHMFTGFLVVFAVIGPFSAAQGVISVPIALQEIVLAVWLIAKGFSSPAIVGGS